ncbi:hypothetical protein ACWTQY_32770, partial [Klebsiella pneumoniae]
AERLLGLTGGGDHRTQRDRDGPRHRVTAAQHGRTGNGRERVRHLNLVNLIGRPQPHHCLMDGAIGALPLLDEAGGVKPTSRKRSPQ